MADLAQQLAVHYELCDRASARSLFAYHDRVVIDSVPPRRFGTVAEPFQRDRLAALGPAIEYVAGFRGDYAGPLSFYLGYSKGCDKTSSLARVLNWLLAYAKRALRAYACAADADQAGLIREAMVAEQKLNPWLAKRLVTGKKTAWGLGTGAVLEILAADAASSHGKNPDLLVLDEITHWENREFFDAMVSATAKRPRCLLIILTNAGVRGSWQWGIREEAQTRPATWHFFEQPPKARLASWMTEAKIEEVRRLLTPSEGRRLLDNVWIDPGEDCGFVTLADALACEDATLTETAVGGRGRRHFAAIDYGEKKDRTTLPILHLEADGRVVLDSLQTWHVPGGSVPVAAVERWMEETHANFPGVEFVVDPHQMVATIQKYEARGYTVHRWEARGGKANYALAQNLRSLILSKRVRWPAGAGRITPPHSPTPYAADASTLASELGDLITRPMSYGYRIDHEASGHDDRAVAVGMAALFAVQNPSQPLPAPAPVPTPKLSPTSLPWAAKRGLFGVTR